MRRMALVLTGVGVVLALCAPTLRAEDQQRSRRSRNSEAAHVQATPAAGSSAPAAARRAVPRRAPAVRTGGQDRNQQAPTIRRSSPGRTSAQTSGARRRVQAAPQRDQQAPTIRRSTPGRTSAQTSGARRRVQAAPKRDQQAPTIRRSTPGRTSAQTSGARRRVQAAPQTEQPAVRQRRPDPANQGNTTRRAVPRVRSGSETRPAGRAGGRDGRVDGRRTPSRTSRPGQTQPRVVSRRPSDRVITRAVPRVRSPLVSRPLIISGRPGGRTRSVLAYRSGYVRPRRGCPHPPAGILRAGDFRHLVLFRGLQHVQCRFRPRLPFLLLPFLLLVRLSLRVRELRLPALPVRLRCRLWTDRHAAVESQAPPRPGVRRRLFCRPSRRFRRRVPEPSSGGRPTSDRDSGRRLRTARLRCADPVGPKDHLRGRPPAAALAARGPAAAPRAILAARRRPCCFLFL